jgi:flagellar protein FlaG
MGEMSNSIASIRSVPEPVAAMIAQPVQPTVEPAAQDSRGLAPKGQTADLRLVIEEDEATGAFVYKTLDRRTGEVVQQLPRESVLKAMASDDYEPGLVVDTRD